MVTVKEKLAQLLTENVASLPQVTPEESKSEPSAYIGNPLFGGGSVYSNTGYVPIMPGLYNGEKNEGSLGNPMNLLPDFRALRFRAYEANLTNDLIKIITGKFFKWVVGNGLKMQSEPNDKVLELEGIQGDTEDFKENVEAYFEQYCKSTRSDYAGMDNVHLNARKVFETAFLGGDCLVVLRVDEKNNVTAQVIDGQHVSTPPEFLQRQKENGNIVVHGIEIDKKGRHIAFYVQKRAFETGIVSFMSLEYERIEAIGAESGCLMAWMVYGQKHRIDHQRGIPMIAAILEKVQKMDRYTEATVSTAEEHSKVVYQIVHGKTSTGENPLISAPRARLTGVPLFEDHALREASAKRISVSENKLVHNMPQDSELKTVSSTAEINYEPFWKAIFLQLCAAVDIPPEVALQQYNSNYSASRAAINGWGYIIDIYRQNLARDYYARFYKLWLYVHVLKGKVKADDYLVALDKGNDDVIEAYSAAKFTGKNMPHIDPLKEINAIRVALADETTPLVTFDEATEMGQFGDFNTNVKKVAKEKKLITSLGLDPPAPAPATTDQRPPNDALGKP